MVSSVAAGARPRGARRSRSAICSAVTSGWSPDSTTNGPALDDVARGEHRGAGALALALLGHLDPVGQPLGDAVAGPHDADHPAGARLARGVDDPLDHGLAADPVQNLGNVRPHPRALAGGHDEDREGLGHGAEGTSERGDLPHRACAAVHRGRRPMLCATGAIGGSSN